LDGKEQPFHSVPSMAAAYVEAIKDVQPRGPYYLGGGSMGGIVALEMAQQLMATGEQVGLVVMFDTYGPHYFEFFASEKSPRHELVHTLRRHARSVSALSPREAYDYIQSRAAARLRDRWEQVASRAYRTAGRPLPHTLRYHELQRLNVDILLKYEPAPYAGKIVLFRALEQPRGVYQEPTMGWSGIARGGLQLVNIPANHNNIIEQPLLGQQLRIVLQQAQRGAEGGPEG
jgi:thioesterase domain-containing protein